MPIPSLTLIITTAVIEAGSAQVAAADAGSSPSCWSSSAAARYTAQHSSIAWMSSASLRTGSMSGWRIEPSGELEAEGLGHLELGGGRCGAASRLQAQPRRPERAARLDGMRERRGSSIAVESLSSRCDGAIRSAWRPWSSFGANRGAMTPAPSDLTAAPRWPGRRRIERRLASSRRRCRTDIGAPCRTRRGLVNRGRYR